MDKDYKALTKARHDYLEAVEQITKTYNQAITQAEEARQKAQAEAWAIRKEAISKAGG